jgi:hypothetical protein
MVCTEAAQAQIVPPPEKLLNIAEMSVVLRSKKLTTERAWFR